MPRCFAALAIERLQMQCLDSDSVRSKAINEGGCSLTSRTERRLMSRALDNAFALSLGSADRSSCLICRHSLNGQSIQINLAPISIGCHGHFVDRAKQ
jgi:hypothetical protein